MTQDRFIFHRPELAQDLCISLEGRGLFDASSGLFLAAPRRTGKSTFLREELVPEMQRRGWVTVYVDLWTDQSRDPASLIGDALKEAIAATGRLKKITKAVGLTKLNIGGTFQFDLEALGKSSGATLADALSYLVQKSKKPVALIVDEAQHALNTPAGINTMFAIKAARDRLNQGSNTTKLFLVFTGSHRDKLAHFVLKKDQPFFGSQITPFPLLGKDFTDAYTEWVNKQLAEKNKFSKADMFKAFELVGHRPEHLKTLIKDVALELGAAHNLGELLQTSALNFRDRIWNDFESEFASLTDLQKAVLQVLIKKEKNFSPFNEESMAEYGKILKHSEFGTQSIQSALEGLRDKHFIWKSARGSYALEDVSIANWFNARKNLT